MHDTCKLTECYDYLLSDDVRAQVEDEEVVVLELFAGQQFDLQE